MIDLLPKKDKERQEWSETIWFNSCVIAFGSCVAYVQHYNLI